MFWHDRKCLCIPENKDKKGIKSLCNTGVNVKLSTSGLISFPLLLESPLFKNSEG